MFDRSQHFLFLGIKVIKSKNVHSFTPPLFDSTVKCRWNTITYGIQSWWGDQTSRNKTIERLTVC